MTTIRERDEAVLFPWDRATCYACGDLLDARERGCQSICGDCNDQANEYADSFEPLALYAAGRSGLSPAGESCRRTPKPSRNVSPGFTSPRPTGRMVHSVCQLGFATGST